MNYIFAFIGGIILGTVIAVVIGWLRRQEAKESFKALSLEALSKNTEQFLKLANETLARQTQTGEKDLEAKKELIDQTLQTTKGELQRIQNLVTNFEKDREQKFGELATQLKSTAEQTGKLQDTTNQLRTALASTKARGQWGERMAEDVLRLAGFVEGINYRKQKALGVEGSRPDYTFFLPRGLIVNMDVKFPFDNYLRWLAAEAETEKERYKKEFLRDARARIKEVTTRDYINPRERTIDYVILFIPNEQVYAFIHENDTSLLDEALRSKVIPCSPLTLYAVLAVIRQAVENFNLEKATTEILALFGTFNQQWDAFAKCLERMGKRIEEARKEFESLTSTRRNQLERPLRQIENLRRQKNIPLGGENNGDKTISGPD